MPGRKNPITVKEKILLHLLTFPKDRFAPDANPGDELYKSTPIGISQPGIADAVGIRWNHVPRAMKDLETEGLVDRFSGTVTGESRRRAVYFLTAIGMEKGTEILDNIEEAELSVTEKGKVNRYTLKEVLSKLPPEFPLLKLVRTLDDLNTTKLDFDSLVVDYETGKDAGEDRPKYIKYTEGQPPLKQFFGRDDEVGQIMEWLESDIRIGVVTGIPGIGKSTLVYHIINEFADKANLFWYQFHEWDTVRAAITPLGEFLSHLSERDLQSYLKTNKTINYSELYNILDKAFEGMQAILVYDDYHKNPERLETMFKLFHQVLRGKEVKILVTSRIQPNFYDRREVRVRGTIGEIRLKGLDEISSKELLMARGIPEDDVDRIIQMTGGHPLALELIRTPGDARRPSDIHRFMNSEIFSKLKPEEQQLLGLASVYRYPIEHEALSVAGLPYEAFDALIEHDLLQEIPYEGIYLHDIVRELAYSRLTPEERQSNHTLAATYYQGKGDLSSLLSATLHFLEAEDFDTAAEILVDNGRMMINRGLLDELHVVIQKLEDNIPTDYHYGMMLISGDLFFAEGEWEAALDKYHTALKSCSSTNYKVRSHAFRQIGHLEMEKGTLDRAVDYFQMALDEAAKLGDRSAEADTMRGLGKIQLRRGDHKRALEYMVRAQESAEAAGDEEVSNEALIDEAMVLNEMNRSTEAVEVCERSIKYFEDQGDNYRVGRAYNELGVAHYILNNLDDARNSWERCIELARNTANTKRLAYALLNVSSVLSKQNKTEEALMYLSESYSILRSMEDRIGESYVHQIYGEVYSELGNWDEAMKHFDESIKIVQEIDMPFNLAERYYFYSQMYKKKGDNKNARKYLEEAMTIYKEHGKGNLIDRVEKELKELNEAEKGGKKK